MNFVTDEMEYALGRLQKVRGFDYAAAHHFALAGIDGLRPTRSVGAAELIEGRLLALNLWTSSQSGVGRLREERA